MIQPTKWSVPLGSGADVQDLPNDDLKFASFSKIFPQITQVPLSAGGVAPRRIDFNSLFKLLADNIYFYQNGGVFEYSDTADYEKGAIVRYNDKIYLCIQDNSALNVHNPDDMNYWLRVALNNELANKADKDLSNVPSSKGILVESYVNGTSGYRKYSDGWCEQWGQINGTSSSFVTVTFLKEFKDTNYTITLGSCSSYSNEPNIAFAGYFGKTTTSMLLGSRIFDNEDLQNVSWIACGYIS